MKYRDKLKQQFAGLEKLSGSELRKRRDALNRAGYMRTKQSATFSTNVAVRPKQRAVVRLRKVGTLPVSLGVSDECC